MISLQRSMHSSQMYTPGPAISFLTWRCDLPQKLQRSCSFESVGRATGALPRRARVPAVSVRHVDTRHAAPTLQQGRALRLAGRAGGDSGRLDDPVDEAVAPGLLRGHEIVPLGVRRDLVEVLAGVVRQDLVEPAAGVDDLLGVDLD